MQKNLLTSAPFIKHRLPCYICGVTFKEQVYGEFEKILSEKISLLQQQLQDLRESTANETKSTAGDKYETSRAILQSEQDNARRQLQELLEQQAQFRAFQRVPVTGSIINGSLVATDKGWFLMGVALGKATVNKMVIVALSSRSPLGKLLFAKRPGELVTLNQATYEILEII